VDTESNTEEKSFFTQLEFRSQLRDLPPSAKLVAKVLDVHAPLDQAQLSKETLLPNRTTRYALKQLEDADLVTSQVNLRDVRKHVYELRYPE
jgi:DNA-binding MarR family transcriptional regulator